MPPWRTPEKGAELKVKFVRLGRDIYVGNTIQDGHGDIAIMDGIEVALDEARVNDNLSVDGGVVEVKESGIYLGGSSGTLQLPVLGKEKAARAVTVQVFRDLNPGFNVQSSIGKERI